MIWQTFWNIFTPSLFSFGRCIYQVNNSLVCTARVSPSNIASECLQIILRNGGKGLIKGFNWRVSSSTVVCKMSLNSRVQVCNSAKVRKLYTLGKHVKCRIQWLLRFGHNKKNKSKDRSLTFERMYAWLNQHMVQCAKQAKINIVSFALETDFFSYQNT